MAEQARRLSYGKNEPPANDAGNTRNGGRDMSHKGEVVEVPTELRWDWYGTELSPS